MCQVVDEHELNIVCNNNNNTVYEASKSESFHSINKTVTWYEPLISDRPLFGQLGKDDFVFRDLNNNSAFEAKQLVFVRGLLLNKK